MSLLVIAHLASPLAGDAPMLDGLLEFEMAQRQGLANKIRRDQPAPPIGAIHIPMLIQRLGVWPVPCSSSPIYAAENDRHEFVAKRLAVEFSEELAPENRNVVAMGNSVFKSYRIPLRIRSIKQVAWFCQGHRGPILKLLKSVKAIGKKRSVGYGRIREWTAEEVPGELHWYAPHESGQVLMRPLPIGPWLPRELLGFKVDFAGVIAPYWHPDRYDEIVTPA